MLTADSFRLVLNFCHSLNHSLMLVDISLVINHVISHVAHLLEMIICRCLKEETFIGLHSTCQMLCDSLAHFEYLLLCVWSFIHIDIFTL